MRSMFANGFHADVFGSRVGGGMMLGQVRLRGYGMGQTTTVSQADRATLLAKLQDAESKSAAIDAYVQAHPNLAADLGADYATFQAGYQQMSQNASGETAVSQQIASPADSYDISGADYTAALAFSDGATQAYSVIQAHPGFASTTPGGVPTTVPVSQNPLAPLIPLLPGQKPPVKPVVPPPAPASNLTAPLLVGGGVLAIGVIALLARG